MSKKKFKPESKLNLKVMSTWVGVFAVIGVTTLLLTKAATPGIAVTVDSTLPNPTNIRAYGDDKIATVTWLPPANASSKGIVGYYITWGTQSGGVYTNAKQTTYNETQIQPLTNGTVYNIKVQSVQGNFTNVSVAGSYENGTAREARANGKVSSGITTTITPSSARVDQLKQQMTGFFDDFNIAAGAFDELKWNTATSACAEPGSIGTFVNNQFHGHTQIRSSCDRAQIINRPRAIFDITGKTEADPGIMAFDFDGVAHGRDAWYIDLIPTTARKSGVPLDITSHASIFDDAPADPFMLRIEQMHDKALVVYYDNNKNPHTITPTFSCPDWGSPSSVFGACNTAEEPKVSGLSPLPEPITTSDCPEWAAKCLNPISNYRRHWIVHVSPSKIKIFIDGILFWEGPMPSTFTNIKQYVVHNNLFSYNTGKGDETLPATALLHWDNFGFNGPAPTTVVHNYLEGGADGKTTYVGTGTQAKNTPGAPRQAKFNIPDPIGSPSQARVMFTINNNGPDNYHWSSSDHILVNGKKYNFANPANNEQPPIMKEWDGTDLLGSSYTPFADSIPISAADLKQGMNDIALNIGANVRYMSLINVHIELEYAKGTEPSYTQPKDIFDASTLLASIQPTNSSHDNYLFVEQDMGLPSGAIDSNTPVTPPPTSGDTTKPTITLTDPADNTTVSGSSFTAAAGASDNVGVTKVEFYIGNTLKATDTSSPYSQSLSTSGLTPGTYSVTAMAYDAAGNTATSNSRSINIPAPADTTKPEVAITMPAASSLLKGSSVNVQAGASDASGIAKVEFFMDGVAFGSADTEEPFTAVLDTTKYSNGSHSLTAKATDTKNNSQTSSAVNVTIDNATADTTSPTVSITAPTAGTSLTGIMAFIQATASDNAGISKVEFFMDGTSLGAADTQAPYQFTLNTTLYPNGSHSLTAKATDTSNNSRTSTAVSITINNADIIAPSIIINSPASGVSISGTYNITVTAADAVGVTKVDFLVDNQQKGTDSVPNPYAYALDTKTLSNGSHTIKVNAYDAANNIGTASVTVNINNAVADNNFKYDFSGNGRVGIEDLLLVVNNYGKNVSAYTKGDVDGDGRVGIQDLIALIGHYGNAV